MRVINLATIFSLLLTVSSCQAAGISIDIEKSPYYAIPAGSTLTLNREITFPADVVSVFIFNGQIVPRPTIDVYKPHCKFELYDMKPQSQTIQPDTFTIRKTVYFDAMYTPGSFFHTGFVLNRYTDGGPSYQPYTTYMYLQSDKQQNVYLLSCLHWEDPVEARYLTVAQIKQALGGMMTLKLNDPRAEPIQPGQKS